MCLYAHVYLRACTLCVCVYTHTFTHTFYMHTYFTQKQHIHIRTHAYTHESTQVSTRQGRGVPRSLLPIHIHGPLSLPHGAALAGRRTQNRANVDAKHDFSRQQVPAAHRDQLCIACQRGACAKSHLFISARTSWRDVCLLDHARVPRIRVRIEREGANLARQFHIQSRPHAEP
jgi:hypothetical protein